MAIYGTIQMSYHDQRKRKRVEELNAELKLRQDISSLGGDAIERARDLARRKFVVFFFNNHLLGIWKIENTK